MTRQVYDVRTADNSYLGVSFPNLENHEEVVEAFKNGDVVEMDEFANMQDIVENDENGVLNFDLVETMQPSGVVDE